MKVVFGLLTLLTSVLPPAMAQVPDHVNDMLRRIFASGDFAPQRFGPAFMAYPNRSHCICEGRGTTLHIFSLLTRYLMEHLPPGPRPAVP